VACLQAYGLTRKEIADLLGISLAEVRRLVGRKTKGVASSKAWVIYFRDRTSIDPSIELPNQRLVDDESPSAQNLGLKGLLWDYSYRESLAATLAGASG
jgi:hypothetical protein